MLRNGKAGHYGLTGMRERAARIGAKLTISSSQRGTEITLFVPDRAIFKSPADTRLMRFLNAVRQSKTSDEL